MKLEIDLSDRTEIAAGHSLLSLLLNNTEAPARADGKGGGVISREDDPTTGALPAAEVFGEAFGFQQPAPVATAMDAQAVFGAAIPQPPSGAPSFAGAAVLPTAPVGPQAILPAMPTTASSPHAAPAAPVAPALPAHAAPASPAGGVELDAKGLPWDGRIHASTKTKTQKGVWIAKRGVNDDAFINGVEAELRALVASVPPAPGAPAPAVTLVAPVAASAIPLPPAIPAAQPITAPAVALPSPGLPAPAPVVAGAALSAPQADPTTFEELMLRVTPMIAAGRVAPGAVAQACTARQLPSVVALQTAPQWVPTIWADLNAAYPGVF